MKKENNASLYIYTGLIFIVAIILIIIAFFGQSRLEQNQPVQVDNSQFNSITQRASVLSEENQVLLQRNKIYEEQTIQQQQEAVELNIQLELYKKKQEINDLLMSANGYASKKDYAQAAQLLEKISKEDLSEDQKILYGQIEKKVNN